MSSAAQHLLCACITADMRSPYTCCASVNQLVGDELLYISSVYVHERAVKSFKPLNLSQFATRSIILL